jgi:hypothetical protein
MMDQIKLKSNWMAYQLSADCFIALSEEHMIKDDMPISTYKIVHTIGKTTAGGVIPGFNT